MLGVVIPLEGEAAGSIRDVLAELDGVIRHMPREVPHISLHVAQEYERSRLDSVLRSLARSASPFAVKVAGFGVFTGQPAILHLNVVRSSRIAVLQRTVSQELVSFSIGPDHHFQPDQWVPHITLARERLAPAEIARAAERLAGRALALELPARSLALLEDMFDGQRILARYPLEG
jgi:2'-5' RNA ligase